MRWCCGGRNGIGKGIVAYGRWSVELGLRYFLWEYIVSVWGFFSRFFPPKTCVPGCLTLFLLNILTCRSPACSRKKKSWAKLQGMPWPNAPTGIPCGSTPVLMGLSRTVDLCYPKHDFVIFFRNGMTLWYRTCLTFYSNSYFLPFPMDEFYNVPL